LAVANVLATVEAYFHSHFGTVNPFVGDEVGAAVGHRFAAGNGTAHSMVLGTAGKNNENFTTFHHVIESVTL